jgi:hypothetical protein
MPYLYDIAEGNVPGHTAWSKIGFNGNVGITEEDVWSLSIKYVYPAAAMQMEVVSTDGDDAAGDTGARTVIISYLDASYNEHSETVTLDGTNPVNTVATDIFRVNFFRVATAGTSAAPEGNLSLRDTAGTVTYSYILAGYTRARNVQYTVPEGKTLYVSSITFTCSEATKGVRVTTRANYDTIIGAVGTIFYPYSEVLLYNDTFVKELEVPTRLPEHTDIRVSCISAQAGAMITCALRGWLEED